MCEAERYTGFLPHDEAPRLLRGTIDAEHPPSSSSLIEKGGTALCQAENYGLA